MDRFALTIYPYSLDTLLIYIMVDLYLHPWCALKRIWLHYSKKITTWWERSYDWKLLNLFGKIYNWNTRFWKGGVYFFILLFIKQLQNGKEINNSTDSFMSLCIFPKDIKAKISIIFLESTFISSFFISIIWEYEILQFFLAITFMDAGSLCCLKLFPESI